MTQCVLSCRAVIHSFLVATLLLPSVAFAHTHLIEGTPKAGSRVTEAPAVVMLHFSEKIEPKFSRVEVTNASGERVDEGKIEASEMGGQMLHAPLKKIQPGKYHVKWKITSSDTHKSHGEFDFTYEPAPSGK